VVVEPGEFTSGSTIRMAELAREAGIPDRVINVVTGYGDPEGQLFAEHPQCDMINFTGSFRVGRIVGGLAASRIKRVGLELGGKRPAIVYADADLAAAADVVARSIFGGDGQACISGSRLIVERKARDAGLERLVDTASKSKMVPNGSEFSAMAHCIVRWQNVLLSARQDSRTLNRGRDPGITPSTPPKSAAATTQGPWRARRGVFPRSVRQTGDRRQVRHLYPDCRASRPQDQTLQSATV